MTRVTYSMGLVVGLALGITSSVPAADRSSCWVVEKTIDSNEKCVPTGIYLGNYSPEELISLAPLDPRVVRFCGIKGRSVQQRAFAAFLEKMSDAQTDCEKKGGTFGFLKPDFRMPLNEDYCLPAVPQVAADRLEEYRVNMEAACPSVVTECRLPCPKTPS